MPRAAVLGSPIAHSLSPLLHRAAYSALGLTDWTYGAVECDEAGLADFIDRLGPEWAGLSLTRPLKRVVLSFADSVSELAADVGAANTMLLSEQGRRLDNTDVGGFVDALGAADVSEPVILGAGGTAAAAVAALRDLGATGVMAVVRDPGRAGELLAAGERLSTPVTLRRWPAVPDTATTVVSTVPAAAAVELSGHHWQPGMTVFDALYHPWPTPLAAAAGVAGARVVGGRELLLWQAARQVRLMTGLPPPVEAMRAALSRA